MRSRVRLLVFVCLAAVADTGAQTSTWRQCATDTSPAAVDACTAIIAASPKHDGAYVNRGIALKRTGDLAGAIRDYTEAIRLNPLAADAFNNRGNAYRALQDLERALSDYDEALRLNRRYAHAYNNRGIVFLEMGEPGFAVTDFDRAILENPRYANAYRNRGIARTEQRFYDLAVEDFETAFRLDPEIGRGTEYALALFGRGRMRLRAGIIEEGQIDMTEAARLLPQVAELMADGSE